MNQGFKSLPYARAAFRPAANGLRRSLLALLLPLFIAASSGAQQQTGSQPGTRQPETKTSEQPAQKSRPETVTAGTGAARTGSITGRVLTDDGHPLPNVMVLAFGLGTGGRPAGDTTDADGRFQLQDLRPAAYNVQVNAPGYVVAPDAGSLSGERRFYHIGESVNLTMLKGGVITGTVTNGAGEPVTAARVSAIRVPKPTERTSSSYRFDTPRMTDDRGVYRLYGLEPGSYLLAVGGNAMQFFGSASAYDGDALTYYPSATRDTAAELTVRAGEELTGIDVRYRGERGHTVSGFVSGNTGEPGSNFSGISIMLLQAASATPESFNFINGNESTRAFALDGVSDGEYRLIAVYTRPTGEAQMALRKIAVRSADVTGLELKLEALGTVTGSVILEAPPKPACAAERGSVMAEIVVNARRDRQEKDEESLPSFFPRLPATPNEKGEFKLSNLPGGSYRLNLQLPDDNWYVRSIIVPGAAAPAPAPPGARSASRSKTDAPGAFMLKAGGSMNGVSITIGQGAGTVRGRVIAAAGAELPAGLRVYLVPVEAERAADPLRYMEAAVESDAAFSLRNVAPGRYWLVARPAAQIGSQNEERPLLAAQTDERERLRREAESAGGQLSLQPCQRLDGYVLNYRPTPPKQPTAQ